MFDLNGIGSNLGGMGSRFTEGVRVGLNPNFVSSAAGNGAGRAALAGKFAGQASKFAAIPGVAAVTASFEDLLNGDLVGAGGSAAGAALAAKAIAPIAMGVNPILGAGLLVAAPALAGMAGGSLTKGIAHSLNQPAQAASNAIANQMPGSTNRVAQGARSAMLEDAETIRQRYGDDLAKAYLQQALMVDKMTDFDRDRANLSMRTATVRNAGRLSEIAAQGGIAMGLEGLRGSNALMTTMAANNPYAQMLGG